MQVTGLNHYNIIAADLGRTVDFYEKVLGLEAKEIPLAGPGFNGRWIYDPQGQPIVHVQGHDPERHGSLSDRPDTTGSIDHVAFTCTDYPGMLKHCEDLGIEHRTSQFKELRQIFLTDPDNVVLELNFWGE